ncbi:MAG: hypothetical protein JST92_26840 [Deltaproteobacteria bacterium]|nr:hypothetical protein [Deltaproteobacteria bacterium]
MLIHVTHRRNQASIEDTGILPPKLAASVAQAAGFGSLNSNIDVVQLLWMADDDPESAQQVVRWIEGSIEENSASLDDLVVFICSDDVNQSAGFAGPSEVRKKAGSRQPPLLYAHNETWCGTVPPGMLKECMSWKAFRQKFAAN